MEHQHEIANASREYARLATRLSDGIEQVEAFISSLPGRVEVYTIIDEGLALVWDKFDGKWRVLLYMKFGGDKDCEVPLVDASVEFKAIATKYLSCFYEDILKKLAEETAKVETGLGALHLFFHPVADASSRPQGAER